MSIDSFIFITDDACSHPARSETFAPKRAPAMGEVVEKDILERSRRIPRRKNSDVDEMKQKKPVAPASVASDRDGSSHQEAFRDRIKSRQRRSEKTCKSGRNSFVVCSQMPNQQQRKMTQTRSLNHHPRNLSIKLFSKNLARRTMLMTAVIVSRPSFIPTLIRRAVFGALHHSHALALHGSVDEGDDGDSDDGEGDDPYMLGIHGAEDDDDDQEEEEEEEDDAAEQSGIPLHRRLMEGLETSGKLSVILLRSDTYSSCASLQGTTQETFWLTF